VDPLTLLALVGGLVLLVVGAESLVRGASRLAAAAGIGPVVIGLTVVAYGTSAPEFAVSVGGAFSGASDVALGNVIGSNAFNLLVVLGLSAVAGGLVVHQRIVRQDVPLLMVVTLLTWLAAADGTIGRLEGGLLLTLGLAYTVWLIRTARRDPEVAATAVPEVGEALAGVRTAPHPLRSVAEALLGLALLAFGADLLVDAAVDLAASLGVSDLMIGLTIVAAGTSLPELATSVVAARRGERDIAVGNVIGSNLFNLMAVLGGSALLAPEGIAVAPAALALDLPAGVLILLLATPALAIGLRMARWEGALLLTAFAAYLVALVRVGTGAATAAELRTPLLVGLGAIGVVILAVGLVLRRRDVARSVG
jgi:cation:H+ antiporter